MKIQVLYNQGSASIQEDAIIFHPPLYFGVTDGISGVYLPNEKPRLIDGKTGGQLASHAIVKSFIDAKPGKSLENIIKEANNTIRAISEENGLSFQETEFLPCAGFVVASIDQKINILQAGDSLAIWKMKDGSLEGTPNRTYKYEKHLLSTIAKLMKKYRGDREKMWKEFAPILIKERRKYFNTDKGGFALLNGQPEFEKFLQKFELRRDDVKLLILFTDGFVPSEYTRSVSSMAKFVADFYQKGGLQRVLRETRKIAKQNRSLTHIDYPEATAIAIEF